MQNNNKKPQQFIYLFLYSMKCERILYSLKNTYKTTILIIRLICIVMNLYDCKPFTELVQKSLRWCVIKGKISRRFIIIT